MVIDNTTDVSDGGYGAATTTSEPADKPEVDPARAALVKERIADIKAAKEHWSKAFDRMRECMKIATWGTKEVFGKEVDGDYVVPITNRMVNQAVATLYAKNPRILAKRKEKLYFKHWDGDPASLQAAMAAMIPPAPSAAMGHNGGPPMVDETTASTWEPPVEAEMIVTEVQEAKAAMLMLDRMAKTLQLVATYFVNEQSAGFKEQLKAAVRRVKTCGVAYVELGFQRTFRPDPDVVAQIADTTSMIAQMEAMLQEMRDDPGKYDEGSAKLEELRLLVADLQSRPEIIAREGPVFGFPRSTEIIPDRECTHLKTFAGCRWVAREYNMSPARVREVYKIDIGSEFTHYKKNAAAASGEKDCEAKLWFVQDKQSQQEYVVCEGYCDFIVEPREPDVKHDRFWKWFPLVVNEVENDEEIFPPSDVWNARHMQREYNSGRQGLREHRIAARPGWVTATGKLSSEDKDKLKNKAPFEILELTSIAPGEDIKSLLQALPLPGVDPNMYETETAFADIQRSVGLAEANFGGTSGDTATESSIAENSRSTANSSDVDDLDTMLGALSHCMGQVLLIEMSLDTVVEIAGPGAVWPDAPPTRDQVAKDLLLSVEAGSSGRPNQAAELAKHERAMPFVTMIPGVNPLPLAKRYMNMLEIDAEDAIVEGLPSIAAMNQMAGQAMNAGAGPDNPGAQGDKGADNQQSQQQNEPQSQPAFPTPGEMTLTI